MYYRGYWRRSPDVACFLHHAFIPVMSWELQRVSRSREEKIYVNANVGIGCFSDCTYVTTHGVRVASSADLAKASQPEGQVGT